MTAYEENNQHKCENDIFYCEKCRKLKTGCTCSKSACKNCNGEYEAQLAEDIASEERERLSGLSDTFPEN